jgi:predicted DNA-binding ribbon-helix-helix protein
MCQSNSKTNSTDYSEMKTEISRKNYATLQDIAQARGITLDSLLSEIVSDSRARFGRAVGQTKSTLGTP